MATAYNPRAIESRWREAWEEAGCHRAPELPDGPKFYNYDSGPFPNGPLHMGHARTYVLGDVTARRQRLLGKSVLYCTEWDAFGQPVEAEARRRGVPPREFTRRWIGKMKRQLRELGISYDWRRVRDTSDPAYYARTQWLFLEMWKRGLIERRELPSSWCETCGIVVSRWQRIEDRCWRCGETTTTRRVSRWFVRFSLYAEKLAASVGDLEGWSDSARKMLLGLLRGESGRAASKEEWIVSRAGIWGTPIPVRHCAGCGPVPVPAAELPVLLPDEIGPPTPPARCPRCGGHARPESETLDCFFDDVWCFVAGLVSPDVGDGIGGAAVEAWMPVDRFHSGFDTVGYLPLHRFLGHALHDWGVWSDAEPIRGYTGHEMVLSRGRKMSKHLGNTVSPSSVIRRHGVDALRVGLLWAAAPHSSLEWDERHATRAATLLREIHDLYSGYVETVARIAPPSGGHSTGERPAAPSRSVRRLRREGDRATRRIGRFIDVDRTNAAVEEWAAWFRRIERLIVPRLNAGRLLPSDIPALNGILGDFAISGSPLAPHLAEEAWCRLGRDPFAALAGWPRPEIEPAAMEPLHRGHHGTFADGPA